MTSIGEVAGKVAALGERAQTLASTLESEYQEVFGTMNRVKQHFQGRDGEAIQLLSAAQGQLLEASGSLWSAKALASAYCARLRR